MRFLLSALNSRHRSVESLDVLCGTCTHTHTHDTQTAKLSRVLKNQSSASTWRRSIVEKKKVLTALAVKIIYLPVHTRAQFLELGCRGHSPSAYQLHIITIIIIIISIIYLHLCNLQLSPCTVDTAGWLHLPCCSENVPTRGHCWARSLRAVN